MNNISIQDLYREKAKKKANSIFKNATILDFELPEKTDRDEWLKLYKRGYKIECSYVDKDVYFKTIDYDKSNPDKICYSFKHANPNSIKFRLLKNNKEKQYGIKQETVIPF